jgi:hypothetical protein
MSQFSISPAWVSAEFGPEEERQTSAELTITMNQSAATRFDDDWSRSVRTAPRLSAYPLAMWLASSWWRMIWEPAPETYANRSLSWRMSHEMGAAGHGFLWPNMTFESDGETVDVISRPSDPSAAEPVHYLSDLRTSVPRSAFERVLSSFLDLVIERLVAVGLASTDLHTIWAEVLEEREDSQVAQYRRLEARLGCDPDEAEESLIEDLQQLALEGGQDAPSEIAPVCSGNAPRMKLTNVLEFAHSAGVLAKIERPKGLDPIGSAGAPWSRGKSLANQTRKVWGLDDDGPVPNAKLSDILGIRETELRNGNHTAGLLPITLAVRSNKAQEMKLLFRKRWETPRRFEAARLLGDHLLAPSDELWLPATDFKTFRQRIQRAFAAEFLCPIESLQDYMKRDFSDSAIEEAANRFNVSPLLVRTHLVNNDLIPRHTAGL